MAPSGPGRLDHPMLYRLLTDAYPAGFDPMATGQNDEPAWLLHFSVMVREGCTALGFDPNQTFRTDAYDRSARADELHRQRLEALNKWVNPDIRVRLLGWWAATSDALAGMAESRPHCVTHVVPAPVSWETWRLILQARSRDRGLLAVAAYEALPVKQSDGPHTLVFEAFTGLGEMEASLRARTQRIYRYRGLPDIPKRLMTAPLALLLQPPKEATQK